MSIADIELIFTLIREGVDVWNEIKGQLPKDQDVTLEMINAEMAKLPEPFEEDDDE